MPFDPIIVIVDFLGGAVVGSVLIEVFKGVFDTLVATLGEASRLPLVFFLLRPFLRTL